MVNFSLRTANPDEINRRAPRKIKAEVGKRKLMFRQAAKGNSITTNIHELPDVSSDRNGLYHFFTTPGSNFCKLLIEHLKLYRLFTIFLFCGS